MIKLKNILTETYAWERQAGKALPTLAEVQAAYDAKMREDVDPEEEVDDDGYPVMDGGRPSGSSADDPFDIDPEEEVDDDGYPVMDGGRPSGSSREVDNDKDPEPEKWSTDKLEKEPDDPFDTDLYDDDDDDGNYYMDEAAKPDFLDLDNDGDETESMKSAADSTAHGNYVNKARAKSQLTNKDVCVYGITGKTGTEITNASDLDKYTKFTVKSKSVKESLNQRVLNNLKGSEYILSETFKRK
jgi:hypothetical protein